MENKIIQKLTGEFAPHTYQCMGADPEIFSVDAKGKLLPAFTYLPSKAARPSPAHPFWDGFQAEFQLHASGCIAFVVDSMHDQLLSLDELLKKKDPKAKLTFKNVFRIPQKVLQETPDQYVALGCMPSFNAYGIKGECMDDGRMLTHRFTGGHIHFQMPSGRYNLEKYEQGKIAYDAPVRATNEYEDRIKACDRIAGIWSVGVAAEMDSPVRRQYYGLPGEFRKPIYTRDASTEIITSEGIEWRTLSNFWCCHPVMMHVTFEVARMAMGMWNHKLLPLWIGDEKEIVRIIAESDVKAARKMLKVNKDMFLWLFYGRWSNDAVEKIYTISQNGLDSLVSDPEDLYKNWRFGREWQRHSESPKANWRNGWDEKL